MSDNIIQLNEDLIKNNLKDLVRNSVEETLNALLDHEADELIRTGKYERTGDRKGYRSGHYERNFGTTSGEVRLRVPKLKGIQFETAIIERYKRRECSVEEALIEMYLASVSVRRVEDITELLWGTKVSSGTISNLNQKAYKHIEKLRPYRLFTQILNINIIYRMNSIFFNIYYRLITMSYLTIPLHYSVHRRYF